MNLMEKEIKYTNDRSTLIVLSLLKSHGIKKVVASPGTTNIALVASMQQDPWFEMYSSVDERSAAYMACGLASESGEPVVITCTGATASRNYFPGLTEAYYRKLPILAITGSHGDEVVGHLHAQSLDRRFQPSDTIKLSVSIDRICTPKDEWATIVKVNTAILELKHRGGGPVHINLRQGYESGFSTGELPLVRKIDRYETTRNLPNITAESVAIFVGSHRIFNQEETKAIETFCERYNAAVFCDHTSGYKGKYKVLYALPGCQSNVSKILNVGLLIHIGEVSADFYSTNKIRGQYTWRVSDDGEIRDLYHNLSAVFEMDELEFFSAYNSLENESKTISLYTKALSQYQSVLSMIPDLPWGNIWCAYVLHDKLPKNSAIHFSIFNSLRSWDFFEIDDSITTNCNVGGFGIDGPISTLIGASFVNPHRIYFGVVGDLAFFYDLNSMGNRHIGKNVRILLINNGVGTEFRNYDHPAAKWGEEANPFMAAAGHFGNKSKTLVKNYAENLGFEYMTADNKDVFLEKIDHFVSSEVLDKPIIFEIFTSNRDESDAIKRVRNISPDDRTFAEIALSKSKSIAKKIIERINK